MRVLVIEDDDQIRVLVRDALEQHGIVVVDAATVAEARRALDGDTYEIVILDLTLPDGSGIEILDHITAAGSAGHVIVLSGATTELDRIRGLELGADDYVVKPFSARELAARVLAVRRRRRAVPVANVRFGPFELDPSARELRRDGVVVAMSAPEFALLAFLVARPGYVFTRRELFTVVWKVSDDQQPPTTVAEHLRRIREIIEVDPRHPQLLRTVRQAGYRFQTPDAHEREIPVPVADATGTLVTVLGRIVDADDAAVALFGVDDPSELVGGNLLDFVAPQSLRSARERLRNVLSRRETRSQVVIIVLADGTELPLEITTSETTRGPDPAVELRLRRAEDNSRRLREMVTGVLSDVADAVVVTDMSMHVRSWNRAAERLYGWSEVEVLGRHLLDVVAWVGDGPDLDAIHDDLVSADRWHGRIQQATRDGSVVEVRASTSVMRDDDGVPLGIVSVNRRVFEQQVETRVVHDDEKDLRRGLAEGEFLVHYQPVVALADEHVVTVEALVRWQHPELGLLGPDAFIDLAERTHAIRELGAFVLAEACSQVAEWRADGAQVALAVNLSAREFANPMLVDQIRTIVAASGLDLRALWLEVTETALVEDVAQASRQLHELAALGIGISIDDFGTGWASLTYLRRFPVHALKIDRSFVTGIDQDPNNAAIVRSILALGAELDLVVVAEGIETRQEADALIALGCTAGQGFLFGRPAPAHEVDLSHVRPPIPKRPTNPATADLLGSLGHVGTALEMLTALAARDEWSHAARRQIAEIRRQLDHVEP